MRIFLGSKDFIWDWWDFFWETNDLLDKCTRFFPV